MFLEINSMEKQHYTKEQVHGLKYDTLNELKKKKEWVYLFHVFVLHQHLALNTNPLFVISIYLSIHLSRVR